MRILRLAFACLAVSGSAALAGVAACGGGGNPVVDSPAIDAPGSAIDAPGSGSACTGALYDPCTDVTASTDCMAGAPGAPLCKPFIGSGFTVCTQSCTVTADCATQNGVPVTCNTKGICKPSAPNACTR
jgi:hypothetical protein